MKKSIVFDDWHIHEFVSFVRNGPVKTKDLKSHFGFSDPDIKSFMYFIDSHLKGVWEDVHIIDGRQFLVVGINDWGLYDYYRNFGRSDPEDSIGRRTTGRPLLFIDRLS